MTHSKKVLRLMRIVERQDYLKAKAEAIEARIKPRLDRIAVRFNRPIERLQAKIEALQAQRDEKLGKVKGGDRVMRLREDVRRLDFEIKNRRAGLNGGELSAFTASATKFHANKTVAGSTER